MMIASLLLYLDARDTEIAITESQAWGRSMKTEKEELNDDYQLYKKLWRQNKSEILEKTNKEYQDFKKENNL